MLNPPIDNNVLREQCPDTYEWTQSYLQTHKAVQDAKQILLNNRVQNFQAADVVALAKIILDLEREYK